MRLEGARILVSGVVLGQPAGGVRRHNAELLPRLARRLAERGAELCVLEGAQPVTFELPPSVTRIASDVPAGPPLLRAVREARVLRAMLERAAADGAPYTLLHTAHLPAPRLPRGLVPHRSLTLHDLRRLDPATTSRLARSAARLALGRATRAADVVLCVSQAVRGELVERLGLDPERIAVVPNAADHLEPLPRTAGPDAPLLCFGHLEPRKDVELLVHALALAPDLPRVVLAGRAKGDAAERVARLAAELGVTERVHLAGPFEDAELPALLATAACAVFPSRLEGFGIGLLEAQRAGVPVAASDLAAHREVAGDAAHWFAPGDARACVAALRTALGSRDDAAHAERARTNAARFTWDAAADAWLAAWERS